jgi:crossover junction endodeoxyribonuclease RuvC
MRILGIDPGTATIGFGIIESDRAKHKLLDYGCIKTQAGLPLPVRLEQIYHDLKTIIQEWSPQYVAIEEIFFSKNVKTAIQVAQARGAILQQIALGKHHITEYKPQQVKEAVCGYGRAEKKQVQKMIKTILGLDEVPRPDDVADALSVAICHANCIPLKNLLSIY